MQALSVYSYVLVVLSVALLITLAGIGKSQLIWQRRKPPLVRPRRRR